MLLTHPLEVMRTRLIINQFHPSSQTPSTLTLQSCINDVYVNVRLLKFGCGLLPSALKVILYILLKDLVANLLKKITTSSLALSGAATTSTSLYIPYSKLKFTEDNSANNDDDKSASVEDSFIKSLMLDYVSGAIAEVCTLPLTVIIKV